MTDKRNTERTAFGVEQRPTDTSRVAINTQQPVGGATHQPPSSAPQTPAPPPKIKI